MRKALIILLLAPSAWALPPERMKPVDQAVGDLDPLSVGLRNQEWGLWEYGQDSDLLEVIDPVPQEFADRPFLMENRFGVHDKLYYRVGRGWRARVMRSEYLIPISHKWKIYDRNVPPRKDRDFIELVPTDTVYELSVDPMFLPRDPEAEAQVKPPPEALIDDLPALRIDGRVDGSVNGRLDGRISP